MAPDRTKGEGRIKWRTIIIPITTLRFWIAFGLVLLVMAGAFAFAWYEYLGPRGQSRSLIARGDLLFGEAVGMGLKELAFDQYKTSQDDLFQAKKHFDDRKWGASKLMAEEALDILTKAVEGLRSEKYFVRERKARVTFAGGSVEVQRAGSLEWEGIRSGGELKKGDRIRTRPGGSCAVLFDDGSQMTIKSDSLVLIDDLSEDVRTRTKNSSIKLLESDVEADILRPTARGSRFQIETPNAVAQISRARMNVRVSKDRQTEFNLQSGDVTVRSGDQEMALGENENLSVTAPGSVTRTHSIPAPVLLSPDHLQWRVSREEKAEAVLSWTPVPGARGYRVAVAPDRYFANPLFPVTQVERASHTFPQMAPGLYYWRVASVDAQGKEGVFSPFRVFRLVRDQTPPALEFSDPILLSGPGFSRLYVSGAAEPGTLLLLRGAPVPLAADGSFAAWLTVGVGTMEVAAVDAAGNRLAETLGVGR